MEFINKLQIQRSDYKYASQAKTQAESLKQLSAGIYTEEERFVYELLQNAVDSFIDTNNSCLDIKISIKDNILCFMHNGLVFSEKDIEGLCDVGKSNKADNGISTNKKKVGYKGIGFKSVFMQSVDYVCVKSGSYCFKFDKGECAKLMPTFPDGDLDPEDTPWQIVPIQCSEPTAFNTTKYNVATYIKSNTIKNISTKIKKLLGNPQFLLFLNANDININFFHNSEKVISAGRKTLNGEVHLICDGNVVSRWLVHTTKPIPVDNTIRNNLKNDFNTPPKLKEATEFEISFAISLTDKGEIQEVEESVLYTFLPTSYKNLGVPFLVNANFITDAGRQQLHQQSEWNRLIFASIPMCFLKWIASISLNRQDYYKILPSMKVKSLDDLTGIYTDSLKSALDSIAFIPSKSGNNLLKVNEAIIDSLGFATIVDQNTMISYLNKEYSKQFTITSFIDCEDYKIFDEYGVFCFNENKLKSYFSDNNSLETITTDKCIDIIDFFVRLTKMSNSKDHIMTALKECKFLVCEDNTAQEPSKCYFPTEYNDDRETYVPIIHSTVFSYIKSNNLLDWFMELGVENLSISNYLRDIYCKKNDNIKIDNAIEVGKIVYDAFMKNTLNDIPKKYLKQLKFLSTKGNLFYADELYISHIYHPQLDLEELIEEDIFVSEKYAEHGDVNIWKSVFQQLGMSERINLKTRRYKGSITNIVSVPQIQESEIVAIETSLKDPNSYVHMYGYDIEYYPAVLNCSDNAILTILFNELFKEEYETEDSSCYLEFRWSIEEHLSVRGDFWERKKNDFSFREFILKYCQLYPTTTGKALHANEIFLNTDINRSLSGEYLPVLNVTSQISEDWASRLPFKRDLFLEDLLSILSKVADDREKDNDERISAIYKRIVELGLQNNPAIKEWGKDHKILSAKDGQYLLPKDMSYITVEGFKNTRKAYIGKHDKLEREGLLQLLKSFGVKIITEDNVRASFDCDIPNTDIPTRLLSTLPALAVLYRDSNEQISYQESKAKLQKRIENTKFYQCKEINLTYDDSGDTISKTTFAQECKFYFTGDLRPSKMEPLLQPLCSFLGIRGKERELFVIMTEPEFSGIVEYLKDKEYDIADIKSETLPTPAGMGSIVSVGGQIGGGIDTVQKIAESNEAKSLVLAKLEKEGFDVSNVDSDWSVITGVTKDGMAYPLVVKSCKNWDHKLFLNPDEWRQLFKPNSMLWLHLGNSIVAPIKAYELFTYQDKLSLTFDTVNLMMDDRINKIMEVMRYFNNVHLDVATLNPDQHRAEHLEEYLFDANNSDNSDLSVSTID